MPSVPHGIVVSTPDTSNAKMRELSASCIMRRIASRTSELSMLSGTFEGCLAVVPKAFLKIAVLAPSRSLNQSARQGVPSILPGDVAGTALPYG